MTSTIPPSQTLYVKNLDSKIKKQELRRQLYALCTVYGRVMDVVATRASGMRGQAFVVFESIQAATSALRGLSGFIFYGRPLDISYAKGKSRAVLKKELGTDAVMQLQLDGALPLAQSGATGTVTVSQSRKRSGRASSSSSSSDEDSSSHSSSDDEQPGPQPKRARKDNVDADTSPVSGEKATLLCTNLPTEVTQDMISTLFHQFEGLTDVTMSPAPPGQKTVSSSTALISFQDTKQAQAAKDGLDGFRFGPTHVLQLTFQ